MSSQYNPNIAPLDNNDKNQQLQQIFVKKAIESKNCIKKLNFHVKPIAYDKRRSKYTIGVIVNIFPCHFIIPPK